MVFRTVCAVGYDDAKAAHSDVAGLVAYLSHASLLRHADYTCSAARPPSVRGADDKLAFDVVDGQPRLYAEYTCRDGLVFKDRARRFMYCRQRSWIGVLPTCMLGMGSCSCCWYFGRIARTPYVPLLHVSHVAYRNSLSGSMKLDSIRNCSRARCHKFLQGPLKVLAIFVFFVMTWNILKFLYIFVMSVSSK